MSAPAERSRKYGHGRKTGRRTLSDLPLGDAVAAVDGLTAFGDDYEPRARKKQTNTTTVISTSERAHERAGDHSRA